MGTARIGFLLGIPLSPVHRMLSRYRLSRLSWLDWATGRVIRRHEHRSPGDLVHVDVKKLCESYQQLVWDWLAGWYRSFRLVVVAQRNNDH